MKTRSPLAGLLMAFVIVGCATMPRQKPVLTAKAVRQAAVTCRADASFHRQKRILGKSKPLPFVSVIYRQEGKEADWSFPDVVCVKAALMPYRYDFMGIRNLAETQD